MRIDLENSLGFKIHKISNRMLSIINPILVEFDIAIEQRATLEIIKYENDVTLTKIASILEKDKTTISRTIRVLEEKAFIKRRSSSEDRRKNMIELTLKGENTLKDSEEVVNNFRYNLISKMSEDEIEILFKLLGKVSTQLEDYNL